MSINKARGFMYWLAKLLGDVQAVNKAARKGSVAPIGKRVARRIAGKLTGRGLGKLFR
jgi:hypothetical protein